MAADLVVESSQISMGGRGRVQMKERLHVGDRYFVRLSEELTQHLDGVRVVGVRGCKPGDAERSRPGELRAQILELLHAGEGRI